MAAKGRDIHLVLVLVGLAVGDGDRLLRIVGRQQLGHQQRGGGQAHTFGGGAGELDVFARRDTVRLVQRQRQPHLAEVAGDDGRALPEAGIEHRMRRAALDLGQLGRHVGVGSAVGFVGDDFDAVVADHLQALGAHRLVESAGARDQRHLGHLARLHVGKDLLAGHAVGMGCLEHPFLDRLDDPDRAGQRQEGNTRRLDHRHRGHGGAGGGAADDDVDLVLLEQALDEGACLFGIAGVVVGHQLQLAPDHAAGGVDLVDIQFQGLEFRVAQECGRTGDRQEGSDADRFLCHGGGRREAHRQGQCCGCESTCPAQGGTDVLHGCVSYRGAALRRDGRSRPGAAKIPEAQLILVPECWY